jgi:hypothetical protein
MEKKQPYLSLGAWPQTPGAFNHHDLTPITKRILKQVHVKALEILPLTFAEFCKM